MSIDERLEATDFPLPAIRQINMAKHASSISLGLGELNNFAVDTKVLDAFINSIRANGAQYTQNAGLPELRTAVAKNQKKEDGFEYTSDNVVITIGVQNAMYASIKVLAKLGATRVLIPEIHFGIYKKIPVEFNLQVVAYPLTHDFGIDTIALKAILQEDDIVIINSPANPTGRVLSSNEMLELGKLFEAKLTKGYVLSDEIYGKLVYEGEPQQTFSKYFNRTIVLDGISKSAAAAGFRVGWVITRSKKLAQAISSNNATIISCPPTANQYAVIPVVNGETKDTIQKYNTQLKVNRNLVLDALDEANIPYVLPRGSFYIFPEIGNLIKTSVKEFCIATAKKENGVVVIPGEAFGAPTHVRISLASIDIEVGIDRFIEAVQEQ